MVLLKSTHIFSGNDKKKLYRLVTFQVQNNAYGDIFTQQISNNVKFNLKEHLSHFRSLSYFNKLLLCSISIKKCKNSINIWTTYELNLYDSLSWSPCVWCHYPSLHTHTPPIMSDHNGHIDTKPLDRNSKRKSSKHISTISSFFIKVTITAGICYCCFVRQTIICTEIFLLAQVFY